MKLKEQFRHLETKLPSALELETRRIIADHLPTIYASEYYVGAAVDPRSDQQIPNFGEVAYLPERRDFPPVMVEAYLRFFFSQVNRAVEYSGQRINISSEARDHFKLLLRKLYTVVSTEQQIKAVEAGTQAALKVAGNNPRRVVFWRVDSDSGKLFERSTGLALFFASAQETRPCPKALLIIDDVSHSGSQLVSTIHSAQIKFPKVPLVISLGAITARAEILVNAVLRKQDKLIFQEKKLNTEELIESVKSAPMRKQLTQLAGAYFRDQCSLRDPAAFVNYLPGYFQATHIVTPFKLPDLVSNGFLSKVLFNGTTTYFDLTSEPARRNKLYPTVL